jgi:large subunit ribosomal protein L14
MKAVSAKVTKLIQLHTKLKCADNTGAKELQLIAVRRFKGIKRTLPRAGVGDIIVCTVKKGRENMRHQIVHCVIVRQSKEYRRFDGTRIKFSDNAAAVINPKTFEAQGTEIRGVVAKEAVERFSTIGKIASIVI